MKQVYKLPSSSLLSSSGSSSAGFSQVWSHLHCHPQETHLMCWQEPMAKPTVVHKLHLTSGAGEETTAQRSQLSKYTTASLLEP